MKVCRHKITKRIIEAQTYGTGKVFVGNNPQYSKADMEFLDMPDNEFRAAIRAQNLAEKIEPL